MFLSPRFGIEHAGIFRQYSCYVKWYNVSLTRNVVRTCRIPSPLAIILYMYTLIHMKMDTQTAERYGGVCVCYTPTTQKRTNGFCFRCTVTI